MELEMEPSLPRPAPRPALSQRVRDWVSWFGAGRLAVTAGSLVVVAVGATWLLRGSPSATEASLPYAPRTTVAATVATTVVVSTASSAIQPAQVVVYVAGAVAVPGVYTLAAPARVDDAVRRAGGPAADADLDAVNLAALVQDGQRIYVPAAGEAVPPTASGPGAPAVTMPVFPVNVNTATADQLDVLPGVGPATAAAIVAYRDQHGAYQSVDDLSEVRGIGPAKLDALRGLVTV